MPERGRPARHAMTVDDAHKQEMYNGEGRALSQPPFPHDRRDGRAGEEGKQPGQRGKTTWFCARQPPRAVGMADTKKRLLNCKGLRRFLGEREKGEENIESNENGFADIEIELFVNAVDANKSVCLFSNPLLLPEAKANIRPHSSACNSFAHTRAARVYFLRARDKDSIIFLSFDGRAEWRSSFEISRLYGLTVVPREGRASSRSPTVKRTNGQTKWGERGRRPVGIGQRSRHFGKGLKRERASGCVRDSVLSLE